MNFYQKNKHGVEDCVGRAVRGGKMWVHASIAADHDRVVEYNHSTYFPCCGVELRYVTVGNASAKT